MNDFTKDELKHILRTYNFIIDDFQEPDITFTIRDKVKRMIESYCESEEHLNYLKIMACQYMESLDERRDVEFNAGQAMGIQLMFKWIEALQNVNK